MAQNQWQGLTSGDSARSKSDIRMADAASRYFNEHFVRARLRVKEFVCLEGSPRSDKTVTKAAVHRNKPRSRARAQFDIGLARRSVSNGPISLSSAIEIAGSRIESSLSCALREHISDGTLKLPGHSLFGLSNSRETLPRTTPQAPPRVRNCL